MGFPQITWRTHLFCHLICLQTGWRAFPAARDAVMIKKRIAFNYTLNNGISKEKVSQPVFFWPKKQKTIEDNAV
jgi:hypothetical protein